MTHKWFHLFTDEGGHSSFVEGHVELTPDFIAAAQTSNREALEIYEGIELEHFHMRQLVGADEAEHREFSGSEGPIFDWCTADAPNARAVTGYYWQAA